MNQRTHAWLAIRALELLRVEDETGDLVIMLEPYANSTAIGAWIPDLPKSKRGRW